MPWATPSLSDVRKMVRGAVTSRLAGATFVGNSVLRIMADAMSGLAHLVLRYIDWLARQLLPDTAEQEWLDRHGDIWLVNADGTVGRKTATLASGSVTLTGTPGVAVPAGTQLSDGLTTYETTQQIFIGSTATAVAVRALNPGAAGNQDVNATLNFVDVLSGTDPTATVVTLSGGADEETDAELRARVLRRIRQPPMGGAAHDYVAWALAVPGVTRAWAASEMGIGTVTVRFMMDDLRADNGGFPLEQDIQAVTDYIENKRPITVKDCFIVGPIPQPIDFNLSNLVPDTEAARSEILASVQDMLMVNAAPGQTIFAAWKNAAIMNAPSVVSFDMTSITDDVMPSVGHMAVLGDLYVGPAQ